MKTSTYLSAYVKCESRKNGSTRIRPKGIVGIAVNNDGWAREWQRLDRISNKCLNKVRARLTAADALAEKAAGANRAMSVAQTYILKRRDGLSNDTTRRLQMAIDVLDAALRKYQETTR